MMFDDAKDVQIHDKQVKNISIDGNIIYPNVKRITFVGKFDNMGIWVNNNDYYPLNDNHEVTINLHDDDTIIVENLPKTQQNRQCKSTSIDISDYHDMDIIYLNTVILSKVPCPEV